MNSRLLVKSLLFLIGIASAITPVALRAAVPPATTPADDTANPYSVIVERNIFHLNPPPPPPEPEKPKVELPVIKITGFVNVGSVSKVLFVSQPKDKKEEQIYYSLAEGEKSSNDKHTFELVKIHPGQDGVDVINDGTPVTLTVKDDSLLPSTTTAAAAAASTPKTGPAPFNPRERMLQQGRSFPPGAGGVGLPSRMRRGPQQ